MMAFTLQDVVPWGRNFDEYVSMFALSDADLQLRILGIGDGPASFNRQLTERGGCVCSCDPIYQFTAEQLRQRIQQTSSRVEQQTRENASNFIWTTIESPDELIRVRHAAMDLFLEDYARWQKEEVGNADSMARAVGNRALSPKRYMAAALPTLPFEDNAFELALSSHFLFLYEKQLDEAFHVAAVKELLRVAREVRIFPLLTLDAKPSALVEPVCRVVSELGATARIETVAYEFQRGGNQMLRIRRG